MIFKQRVLYLAVLILYTKTNQTYESICVNSVNFNDNQLFFIVLINIESENDYFIIDKFSLFGVRINNKEYSYNKEITLENIKEYSEVLKRIPNNDDQSIETTYNHSYFSKPRNKPLNIITISYSGDYLFDNNTQNKTSYIYFPFSVYNVNFNAPIKITDKNNGTNNSFLSIEWLNLPNNNINQLVECFNEITKDEWNLLYERFDNITLRNVHSLENNKNYKEESIKMSLINTKEDLNTLLNSLKSTPIYFFNKKYNNEREVRIYIPEANTINNKKIRKNIPKTEIVIVSALSLIFVVVMVYLVVKSASFGTIINI